METTHHPLRAWRETNGISLREMAARLIGADGAPMLSHVSLGRIERGTQPPSIEVMRAIAAETGNEVRPEHMVAAYGPESSVKSPVEPAEAGQ